MQLLMDIRQSNVYYQLCFIERGDMQRNANLNLKKSPVHAVCSPFSIGVQSFDENPAFFKI